MISFGCRQRLGRSIPRISTTLNHRCMSSRVRRGKNKRLEGKKKPSKPTSRKPKPPQEPVSSDWFSKVAPYKYRKTGERYAREELIAIASRVPVFLVLVGLITWEETTPYSLLRIHGPSMIPTMAPDQSDIWLRSTGKWMLWQSKDDYYQIGDLVGFASPSHPHRISCKRIIAKAGETTKRYGQYVHLYKDQDPVNWGAEWPDPSDENYTWIDRSCAWDRDYCDRNKEMEQQRTLVVPDGHVWLESDCPALGLDSRQVGPIPVEWLRGKIVARLWPLWKKNEYVYRTRPHPSPLDDASLRQHNIHPVPRKQTN